MNFVGVEAHGVALGKGIGWPPADDFGRKSVKALPPFLLWHS